MRTSLFIATLLTLTSCGPDCIDKKTGLHKSSQTLKDSKENKVFNFEMLSDQSRFHLDKGKVFKIKNAWIENSWTYECIDNNAVIHKENSFQLVIDAEYEGNFIDSEYWLMNKGLGSVLDYRYLGQDTIRLTLTKNKSIIDTLTFVRKVSR